MAEDPLKCPRCQTALKHEAFRDLPVQRCSRCKGFWVAQAAQRQVHEMPSYKVAPEEKARIQNLCRKAKHDEPAIDCPVCLGGMDRIGLPELDIYLDRCAQDGTWFDEGELQHMKTIRVGPPQTQKTSGPSESRTGEFGAGDVFLGVCDVLSTFLP